ncbi:hypothetical protein HanIR_Chr05g0246521 [Helianthus annuus]|nr:hypothetical protein HanIR_Chr05g0246521 [Helianthus annuus]
MGWSLVGGSGVECIGLLAELWGWGGVILGLVIGGWDEVGCCEGLGTGGPVDWLGWGGVVGCSVEGVTEGKEVGKKEGWSVLGSSRKV